MYRFLTVSKIGDLKVSTKNGGEYRQVWFRPLTMLPNGVKVFSNQAEKSRTLFGAHDDFKADPLFTAIQAGEIKEGVAVEGTIVKFNTTEYKPDGFTTPVNVYTAVVFSNEDAVKVANRQLKQSYACVIGDGGVLTAEEQLSKPVTASLSFATSE